MGDKARDKRKLWKEGGKGRELNSEPKMASSVCSFLNRVGATKAVLLVGCIAIYL